MISHRLPIQVSESEAAQAEFFNTSAEIVLKDCFNPRSIPSGTVQLGTHKHDLQQF